MCASSRRILGSFPPVSTGGDFPLPGRHPARRAADQRPGCIVAETFSWPQEHLLNCSLPAPGLFLLSLTNPCAQRSTASRRTLESSQKSWEENINHWQSKTIYSPMLFCITTLPPPVLLSTILLQHSIPTGADHAKSKGSARVKAYYPTYNHVGQPPSKIDWDAYTDVLFFMVIPEANFTLSFDPVLTPSQGEDLVTEFVAQARKHDVNPVLSTGGWTGSRHFSNLTATSSSRERFAQVLVQFAKKHGFHGIEIDWEYPNSDGIGCNSRNKNDVVNFGLFTKELRTLWPEIELTAAVTLEGLVGSDGKPATKHETALLSENLDFVNLMAYDVYGPWSDTTGPLAPLLATCAPASAAQSVETGLQVALKQGFKASQVLLGIPGYANRFQLISPELVPKTVDKQTTLYYQNKTKVTPRGGRFDDKPGHDVCGQPQAWGGSFLVRELVRRGWLSKDQKHGLNGYTRYFDECSGEPFLTNGKYLISYDDEDSTIAKAKFAKEKNMGGIYFFDTMGPTKSTLSEARKIFSE
ncbi:hypothetical protein PCANC_00299 [Puccinia coronata f. sp. avenae]|uniref:GH18 domain-containing protein n=1 Tax=Puccinia coronata f. sp. avenae TaxID=200324 RepID=A0A2N5W9F3_9BASI|nr:hypothetical protein PCANC_05008 [Puccinia coronata f. sp. avenae]PLW22798.1 hypothetical protein PCASD_12154 [Puccinia coronata f. sp. avenae]PLW58857.1 hypothetical protein PCANC_00299 [Puccinia coronata f. sp. avenae]